MFTAQKIRDLNIEKMIVAKYIPTIEKEIFNAAINGLNSVTVFLDPDTFPFALQKLVQYLTKLEYKSSYQEKLYHTSINPRVLVVWAN